MMRLKHLITQNPALKLETSVGINHRQISCCTVYILMHFWGLQSLSRAEQFGVAWWRPKHRQTHTHQPTPCSPAIQTHSHAFTHLLCPPHEELKIDDSTTERVGRRRGIGEKDEEGSHSCCHRAHQRWEEEELEIKKYNIARKKKVKTRQ